MFSAYERGDTHKASCYNRLVLVNVSVNIVSYM